MSAPSERGATYGIDNSGGVGLEAVSGQKKSVKLQKLGPNPNDKMQMAQKTVVDSDRESEELELLEIRPAQLDL